jgi:hypothetical protein
MCAGAGIAFISWYPLAAGSLASPDSPLVRRLGATPSQIALAWLLQRSPAILPIPGTSSMGYLEESLASAPLRLSADEYRTLASLWCAPGICRRQERSHRRVNLAPLRVPLGHCLGIRSADRWGRKWGSNFWPLSRGCRLVFRGRSGSRPSALRLGLIASANRAAISRVTLATIASAKIDDIFRL